MSALTAYKEALIPYWNFDDLLPLKTYLQQESRLPSPQANLTLANAFAIMSKERAISIEILRPWLKITCNDDEPAFFLSFCAMSAIGMNYVTQPQEWMRQAIHDAMNDKRWRMREAAAIALQYIGEEDENIMKTLLLSYCEHASCLEYRCVMASLAHPPILKQHPELADWALRIADHIFHEVYDTTETYDKNDLTALTKCMSYALSVFLVYVPKQGFSWLDTWAKSSDKTIKNIVKSNCKKGRIAKPYPDECARIITMLEKSN